MIEITVKFEERKDDDPEKQGMVMFCESKGQETATSSEKGMSYPLFKAIQGYLNGMAVASGNAIHMDGPNVKESDINTLLAARRAQRPEPPSEQPPGSPS